MEMYLSAEDRAFREEVRAFLRDKLPPALAAKARSTSHLTKQEINQWQGILHSRGWGAVSWPREYGGTGWTPMQRFLFASECAAAGAPGQSPFGVLMVAPVIYTFGTQEQKDRYLPRILAGTENWCQGYSEPGAGSDLAGLRTKAEVDGNDYVVNGSKIWTTHAHKADMIFCLVRTDPDAKKQRGISFLLIDMKSPGITVRPLITIDGGHSVNEVFFENVRVPRQNLVGDENNGWTCAKFLLEHERAGTADVPGSKRRLQLLKDIVSGEQAGGAPIGDDPQLAFKIAGAEIDLMALETTNMRLLLSDDKSLMAQLAPSMMKLRGSEVTQQMTELAVEALGYAGLPYQLQPDGTHQSTGAADYASGRVEDYLFLRAATIYAGSSETQRNILAKALFGV